MMTFQSQPMRRSQPIRPRQWIISLIKKVNDDDCFGLSGEMAYTLILSLIPLFVLMVGLLGVIGEQKEIYPLIVSFVARMAPKHATSLILDTLHAVIDSPSANITVLGLLGTLWSASNVGNVVIKGLERAYGLSEKYFSIWYRPILSVLIVLSFGLVMVLSAYFVILGNVMVDWVYRLFGHAESLAFWFQGWLKLLRWFVIVSGILTSVGFTYTLVLRPKIGRNAWKKAFAGSLFFVFSWLVLSLLFSFYVDNLNQINPVYGALGAPIVLVTWLYYSSLAFFVGGEITALHAVNGRSN